MKSSKSNSSDSSDPKNLATVEINELNPVLSTVLSLNGKEILIHEQDVDLAMKYQDESAGMVLDPVYEKKLLRKIDWCIMPMIGALMSCQLMDKTTNSYASIMGLQAGLGMSTQEYSWVGSSFYLGYLVFVFPANLLLQRFPLSKTLSTAVILWGVILMCHAACHSSATFLLCRVLLGFGESFMNSSYIILTTQWYRKEEQFMRTCLWWGLQGFGTLVGAGIAHGLAVYRTGDHDFASWRLIFIITGVITIGLGFTSMVHIPDVPVKAWFLNDLEKKYCVERVRTNQQGFGNQHFKLSQLIEAFKDPVIYIFFIYGMSYAIPNGGFTNFGSILLKGDFGFDTNTALLMNMPGGAIDIVIPPAIAIINYKYFGNRRLICSFIVQLVVIIGMCLLNFTDHKGSKLTGYLSFYVATAVSGCMASILSSNVAGHTKKVSFNTVYLVGYCAGNAIGPQTFIAKQAPGYIGAKTAMLVSFIAGAFCLAGCYFIYTRRNLIKDKQRDALGDAYKVPANIAFADLTDKENPEFRYSL